MTSTGLQAEFAQVLRQQVGGQIPASAFHHVDLTNPEAIRQTLKEHGATPRKVTLIVDEWHARQG